MTEHPVAPNDADDVATYRLAGLSGIAIGLAYVGIMGLYALTGPPPTTGAEWLAYLAGRTDPWVTIVGLSVVTDILFLPLAVGLYMGLQRIHRAATIAGAGLVALFAILDLGLTWPAISALLSLSEQYGAASATTDRGALLAAATYGTTALSTGLFASYAILVPALGVGLLGWVMLRSPFGPPSGMVAIAAGGLGVVAVVGPLVAPDLGSAVIASSALTTIWVILAGIRLLRMADDARAATGTRLGRTMIR